MYSLNIGNPSGGKTVLISGRKYDSRGKPLAGAVVKLLKPSDSTQLGRTETDANGGYTIEVLYSTVGPGVYTIAFYAQGISQGLYPAGDWEQINIPLELFIPAGTAPASGMLGTDSSGYVAWLNTVPAAVLGNSTVYIGTTGIALDRASAVLALAGISSIGIRDTSAAYDVTIGMTSSTMLTGAKTLTIDMVNTSSTIKLGYNLTLTAAASIGGTNTGDQTLAGLGGVPTSRTVGGHALTGDVTLAQADISGLTTGSTPAFISVNLSGLTSGYVPYHNGSALANSPLYTDGTKVGIGTTSPLYRASIIVATTTGSVGCLFTNTTFTNPSSSIVETSHTLAVALSGNQTGPYTFYGIAESVTTANDSHTYDSGTQARLLSFTFQHQGSQTFPDARGAFVDMQNTGSGIVTDMHSLDVYGRNTGSGSVGRWVGLNVRGISVTAGSMTNAYGVLVGDMSTSTNAYGVASAISSGTGNRYNIYAYGTAANYFAGNVGIGTMAQINEILTLKNATWLGAVNAAGNGSQKIISLNANNIIAFGSARATASKPANFVANYYIEFQDLNGANFYVPAMNAAW